MGSEEPARAIRKVAQMLEHHLRNILTRCLHRITNAPMEGINSPIQAVRAPASGRGKQQNLKTVTYFFCRGLNQYPR